MVVNDIRILEHLKILEKINKPSIDLQPYLLNRCQLGSIPFVNVNLLFPAQRILLAVAMAKSPRAKIKQLSKHARLLGGHR